jgi:hypothetical protein
LAITIGFDYWLSLLAFTFGFDYWHSLLASSFGFNYFQVIKVSKYSFVKVAYAYMDLILKILFKRKQPIAWRRYQRVMLICSKNRNVELDLGSKIKRQEWDGTES